MATMSVILKSITILSVLWNCNIIILYGKYSKYCYQNGAFTGDMTMEQMIDFCTPMMVQANPGMTAEQAKEQMFKFFPMLLRWKK